MQGVSWGSSDKSNIVDIVVSKSNHAILTLSTIKNVKTCKIGRFDQAVTAFGVNCPRRAIVLTKKQPSQTAIN